MSASARPGPPSRRFQVLCLALGWGGVLFAGRARAFNHWEIPWRSTETPHYRVLYPPELEPMARRVTEIAEAVYPGLASTYGVPFRPGDRIRLVLMDTDDYSNGYTWADARQVVLYATSLDTPLRGQHDWLWDVLPHELGHVFSLRAADPFPENIPGFSLDAIAENLDQRTLLGGSLFLPSEVVPGWYAEGAAQMDAQALGSERWDARRDMLLGMSWLGGTLLDLDRMGSFEGKGSIDAERIYNQGFDFLSFLERKEGRGSRGRVARAAGKAWRPTLGGALRSVYGAKAVVLEQAWHRDLEQRYAPWRATWAAELARARILQTEGTVNLSPRASPSSTEYAFLSNRGGDFGAHTLYRAAIGREAEAIEGGAGSFDWDPKGRWIIFTSSRSFEIHGSSFTDLWRLDLDTQEVHRLTVEARASEPAVSPDGRQIAFIHNERGSRNLWLMPATGGPVLRLTDRQDFSQAEHPAWSPDGRRIAFALHQGQRSALWEIAPDGANLRPLSEGRGEDRDPAWSPDRRWLLFSSDRTGRFDLYALGATSGELFRLTDVAGGAFHPSPTSDFSSILYAGFTPTGFAVFSLPTTAALWIPSGVEHPAVPTAEASAEPAVPLPSSPYRLLLRPLRVVPGALYESFGSDRLLLGGMLALDDVVDHHALVALGYAGVNQQAYDAGAGYRNDQLPITLFIDGTRRVRMFPTPIDVLGGSLAGSVRFTSDSAEAGGGFDFAKPLDAQEGASNRVRVSGRYLRDEEEYFAGGVSLFNPSLAAREAHVEWTVEGFAARDDADINPSDGRRITFSASQRWTESTPSLPYPEGNRTLPPTYSATRLEGSWMEALSLLDRITGSVTLSGGWISRPVLPLDRFYLGGYYSFLTITGVDLANFPGYAPLRLQGERYVLAGAALTFPLARDLGVRWGPFYLDKIYGSWFGDAGNAFLEDARDRDPYGLESSGSCRSLLDCSLLYDAGLDLRVKGTVFYRVPFNSFVKVAYGFQSMALGRRQASAQAAATGTPAAVASSDQPWRVYLGIGTGF